MYINDRTMVVPFQRRCGGAVALAVASLLLLLGLSNHAVEAKKVKRVKAGTTYKTHDRKCFFVDVAKAEFLGPFVFIPPSPLETSRAAGEQIILDRY
jgi:hypothetical protein